MMTRFESSPFEYCFINASTCVCSDWCNVNHQEDFSNLWRRSVDPTDVTNRYLTTKGPYLEEQQL